jgi:hypothetical protein
VSGMNAETLVIIIAGILVAIAALIYIVRR